MKPKTTKWAPARCLDSLLSKIGSFRTELGTQSISPQAIQGQGSLGRPGKVLFASLYWHLPFLLRLAYAERKWAIETVCTFYRAYFRSLEIHFPSLELDGMVDLSCGRDIQSVTDLVSLLKDVGTSPLSYCLKNSGELLCPVYGGPAKYIRRALRRLSARAVHFANDALQFKNSTPKMIKHLVTVNLEKHRARMIAPCRQSTSFMDEVTECASVLVSELGIFNSYSLMEDRPVENLSMAACVESNRLNGGSYGYYFYHQGPFDQSGNFRPDIRHFDVSECGVSTYITKMHPTEGQLLRELQQLISQGDLRRKVVGITEPLKVRVITAHHACESVWSGWQKYVARHLSRIRECTSGKEVIFSNQDLLYMRSVQERIEQVYGEEAVVVSDDASAATDSISPELSQRVSDLVWAEDGLGRAEFHDCWLGSIEYNSSTGLGVAEQMNGQLMGGRPSFPTLCLIHIAAKRAFLTHHPKVVPFIRVNGDDGVIILPRSLVPSYFKFMEELWVINKMKTYVSRDYFSFNSALWSLPKRKTVPLTRFKLIDGVNKNGEPARDPRVYNRCMQDCASYARESVHQFFVSSKNWRPILSAASKMDVNWFLPEVAGGLGLLPFVGEPSLTSRQRGAIVAAYGGSTEFQTKTVKSDLHRVKVHKFSLPPRVGFGVREEGPLVRSYKAITSDVSLHWPDLRKADRIFRDVVRELWELRSAGTHYCVGAGCLNCFQKHPGVSIEHCESCLPQNEERN